MLQECEATYSAMEGEYEQVTANCRRAKDSDVCTKEEKKEVEVKVDLFTKAVGDFLMQLLTICNG